MNEELSLIGQLYDAALDPDLWTEVLGQCDRYFNSAQTFIAIENAVTPSASTFYASIHDPAWLEQYAKSYMLINPMRLALTGRAGAGDIVLTCDFMTESEYRATRFAREFLSERRITDIAVAILEMTATRITVLSTQRSYEQGFADEVLRKKLQLVLPHAQRAVRIAGLLEHHKMMSATMADTLDLLAAAVFLVTAAGGLVHANARGNDLLDGRHVVRAVHGRLVLADRAAGAALADAIAKAAHGDGAVGTAGCSISCCASGERKHMVTVMPLTTGRRQAIGSPHRAVAAVCILEAEFKFQADASAVASFHGLTRREAAILVAMVEIGGVPDVSSAMGISEATVRTHLKSIYRKTGTCRQADLVKLLAGVTGPLGSA